MKFKRFVAAFAAVVTVMTCGLFAVGCGGGTEQSECRVRISRWALEWEKDVFRAWTKEFTDENPDVVIEWEFTPYTAHFDRLRTDLLGGQAADIIFVNNWGWAPYSKLDVFEDLSTVDGLKDTFASLVTEVPSSFRSDGKTLGLPVGMVSRVPVVNTDDFKAAGVEVPQKTTAFTGDELAGILGDVADGSDRAMGINITLTDALAIFLASADAPLVTADGKIGCNTEAGIKAVGDFFRFAKSGVVVPLSQNNAGSYGSPDTAIMSGNCVAGWVNCGELSSLADNGYAGKLATIPSVKADGGKDVVLADFNTLVVPKFSKSKDAAYKVMKWMLSKEAQLKYAKFSDLPVNKAAFDEIGTDTENWDPTLYAAYGVGIDNIYVSPATSTAFQTLYGGALKDLLDEKITPAQFCEKMATDGAKYL